MGVGLWGLLMLRRKLWGGGFFRPGPLDCVGALGLAVHMALMPWDAMGLAVCAISAWAVFPIARIVLRQGWNWAPLALLAGVASPIGAVSGIGLGVFLVMAVRGFDPLARGAGAALLCMVPAFLWLGGHPPDAPWAAVAAGLASALAFALWLAVQRTRSSSGS